MLSSWPSCCSSAPPAPADLEGLRSRAEAEEDALREEEEEEEEESAAGSEKAGSPPEPSTAAGKAARGTPEASMSTVPVQAPLPAAALAEAAAPAA